MALRGPEQRDGRAWTEAIKEFEATHPGVEVKFEEKSFEQIQKTAPMVLNSSDAPDLLEYNKGNATAGLLSRQGLLTDLTAEAAKRGWDKLLSAGVRTTSRYDTDGVMGSSGPDEGDPDPGLMNPRMGRTEASLHRMVGDRGVARAAGHA